MAARVGITEGAVVKVGTAGLVGLAGDPDKPPLVGTVAVLTGLEMAVERVAVAPATAGAPELAAQADNSPTPSASRVIAPRAKNVGPVLFIPIMPDPSTSQAPYNKQSDLNGQIALQRRLIVLGGRRCFF